PPSTHESLVHRVCRVPPRGPGDGSGLMATGGADGSVRLWHPETGETAGETMTGHHGPVHGLCTVPPDGLLASAGADGTVRLWNPVTGRAVGDPITGHTGPVHGVCAVPGAGPDGRTLLASSGTDGSVRLWDVGTGRQHGEPLL